MNEKVLLAVLRERQSAKGTRYLSGWLGKARIVGFLDRDAPDGEVQWQVYAHAPSEPGAQAGGEDRGQSRTAQGARQVDQVSGSRRHG